MSGKPGQVQPHRHQAWTLYGRERLQAQRQAALELASRIADFVATSGIWEASLAHAGGVRGPTGCTCARLGWSEGVYAVKPGDYAPTDPGGPRGTHQFRNDAELWAYCDANRALVLEALAATILALPTAEAKERLAGLEKRNPNVRQLLREAIKRRRLRDAGGQA